MVKTKPRYIDAKTFGEFCANQRTLIDVLNHRMTTMSDDVNSVKISISSIKTDVGWTKKLLWAIFGVLIAALLAIVIKSAIGI